jgi:hypothetical protein
VHGRNGGRIGEHQRECDAAEQATHNGSLADF